MSASSALTPLLQRAPRLGEALRAAREVGAPDWLIGAGAVRDAVWDLLHDREPAPPRDVDGLGDLLGCVCRHNPVRVTAALYERRIAEKGWRERWPRLRVLPAVA